VKCVICRHTSVDGTIHGSQETELIAEANSELKSDARTAITSGQVMLALGAIFLLNLLLRVFYIRYDFVNGDEGVRALSAVQMLDGARLYADVVTDKPPGASLFYAAVFAMFGRSMKAVHLAATAWNFGTSVIVYLTASRFYNRRTGLWAALLFVYFSANYFTQDMMAANTELLMVLPYTASFCLFMVARQGNGTSARSSSSSALVAAGVLTGVAALFKQIGVLNLLFFALFELLVVWKEREKRLNDHTWLMASVRRVIGHLALIALGFALALTAFVLWLSSMGALGDFWRNGVVLSMAYVDSEASGLWLKFMIGRGLGYVFFNAALWSLAGWAFLRAVRERKLQRSDTIEEMETTEHISFDMAVAIWCAISLLGVMLSGRFFGHYFIPSLPALSLLAARGLRLLPAALRTRKGQVAVGVLTLLFLVGLFRTQHRTAVLAYETLTGNRTRWSANWGMTKREQEAEVVSLFVRERVREGESLYIWGYAHDVFWRTRCRPASRYLAPYYIDGRFPDAEGSVPESGVKFRREAAANLMEDLRRHRPRLILDVEGSFMSLPHPELVAFVEEHYRAEGNLGPDPGRPFRAYELIGEVQTSERPGRR
jgi:4-amino-4-deoxy-L-arabinose transferase-like glycosyltransferase